MHFYHGSPDQYVMPSARLHLSRRSGAYPLGGTHHNASGQYRHVFGALGYLYSEGLVFWHNPQKRVVEGWDLNLDIDNNASYILFSAPVSARVSSTHQIEHKHEPFRTLKGITL